MTHDLLTGVWVKINRAKKHFSELESAVIAFNQGNPYRFEVDEHSEPGHECYRVRFNRAIPQDWGGIIGDIIHNLRSALDNLATALAKHNGTTSSRMLKDTYFPIGATKEVFQDKISRDLKGASSNAIRLVQRLKPYKGGNDALWRIHQLDILDKHTVIVPVGACNTSVGLQFQSMLPMPIELPFLFLKPASYRDFLKDGDVVFRYGLGSDPDGKHKPNLKIEITIAFGEGQIVDGEPVTPMLKQFIDFVERVMKIFERHVFK